MAEKRQTSAQSRHTLKKVSFFDFKGLMAPVFTCFKDDENFTLDLTHIDQYARWLKQKKVKGILVNSITGEGPALGVKERKIHAENWWRAATEHELIMMVQIGGAPLPDVLDMATHAEQLGVHGVLCLPELFYKPKTIEHLVGYCALVAKKCHSRPFFYYHIPHFTNVDLDMGDFCQKAEDMIPNFYGIQFSSENLDMGSRCLRHGRVILLGASTLLACGLLLGFDSGLMSIINVRPELCWEIYDAMNRNDVRVAKEKQKQINDLIRLHGTNVSEDDYVATFKRMFNEETGSGAGFQVGPSRRFY